MLRKGLLDFSNPIDVSGPWPGKTVTRSFKGNILHKIVTKGVTLEVNKNKGKAWLITSLNNPEYLE